jgi:uncharacterized membrane protein YoaK (UPF0700 family)
VGGYVDVICVVRYSTFVATMTGNLVITGQTLYEALPIHRVSAGKPTKHHSHLAPDLAAWLVLFRSTIMLCNCIGALCYCELQKRFPNGTVSKAAPFVAVLAIMPDLVPWLVERLGGAADETTNISMWSVAGLGFSLGFTHFMCSPAAEGSRLKAVTMAATGHMHGATKLLHKLVSGKELKPEEREKMAQSCNVTICMLLGAFIGAAALHLNPLGDDDWLLLPVGVALFCALTAHDAGIEPPGGWPKVGGTGSDGGRGGDLRQPLAEGAFPAGPAPVPVDPRV